MGLRDWEGGRWVPTTDPCNELQDRSQKPSFTFLKYKNSATNKSKGRPRSELLDPRVQGQGNTGTGDQLCLQHQTAPLPLPRRVREDIAEAEKPPVFTVRPEGSQTASLEGRDSFPSGYMPEAESRVTFI